MRKQTKEPFHKSIEGFENGIFMSPSQRSRYPGRPQGLILRRGTYFLIRRVVL